MAFTSHHARSVMTVLLLAATAASQDMIAVSFSGQLFAVDSFAGTATPFGSGRLGQNALAVDPDGVMWSSRLGNGGAHDMTVIDPVLGTATVMFPSSDLRALAFAGSQLYGIQEAAVDQLVRIDTDTGAFTTIGATSRSTIQGMASHAGRLFAWDLVVGLCTIDPSTGATVDVNPLIGDGGRGLQWMASRSDGKLLAGRDAVFEIDIVTGSATQLAVLGTNLDLRGCDEWYGRGRPFGAGCNGSYGPVTLTAGGTVAGGRTMTTRSTNHTVGTLGILLLGFDDRSFAGSPLPALVDPLFGTQNCRLYTSIDASLYGIATSTMPATLTFALPLPTGFGGFVFHAQHVAFEQVPGGLSWSNGLRIRLTP